MGSKGKEASISSPISGRDVAAKTLRRGGGEGRGERGGGEEGRRGGGEQGREEGRRGEERRGEGRGDPHTWKKAS